MKKSHTSKTVKYLYKNGIRLICIDFDRTFISIHTKGKWDKSAIKLTDYIRPVFINMIRTAVNVCGDAAVSCIVAKSEHEIDEKIYNG